MTGIELIAEERKQQIEKHGCTVEFDVKFNTNDQLSNAANKLCERIVGNPYGYMEPEGWDEDYWDRVTDKSYKERLIIAGALIAAEIDRLQAIGE